MSSRTGPWTEALGLGLGHRRSAYVTAVIRIELCRDENFHRAACLVTARAELGITYVPSTDPAPTFSRDPMSSREKRESCHSGYIQR